MKKFDVNIATTTTWCSLLNSYWAKFDETTPDQCPKCSGSPHDVRHLFDCPQHPTDLTTESLWTKPIEAADFLELNNEDDEN